MVADGGLLVPSSTSGSDGVSTTARSPVELGVAPSLAVTTPMSFSIPISTLTDPVSVNSQVNFAAIVGNPDGPTDTLLGIATSSIPEPSPLTMAGLACACVGWFAWMGRSPCLTLPEG